eukprot:TRINITY_DN3875_c0_g1_i1.p1 TRINITY_DN3875_c0_g1~~TRINITY_DN3875_c0_g1_i1.p1  ORF type:complete len:293 (+),score=64.61 TRINITY_DN3875_c0_g1_i1:137-1015(+)
MCIRDRFWFSGAVANNLATKHALRQTPLPLLVCTVGMLVQIAITQGVRTRSQGGIPGCLLVSPCGWLPRSTVVVLSVATAAAFICHRLALSFGSVSFTITVKSCNVAITALIAAIRDPSLFSGIRPIAVMLVVAGIGIAAAAESPFPASCLLAALGSGLAVSLKTAIAKPVLKKASPAQRVELYGDSMLGAVLVTLPACLLLEAPAILEFWPKMSIERVAEVVISGGCLWWMEYGCYVYLARVSTVSHGIANGLCSLCVIVCGSLAAGSWPTVQQMAGVGTTSLGVALYNFT